MTSNVHRSWGVVGGGEALFYLPPPAVDFRSPSRESWLLTCFSLGCSNKHHRRGDDRHVFPTVLEAGPRSRPWQIWSLVWACFLAHRWPSIAVPSPGGRGGVLSVASFTRALTPFMWPLPSRPSHLPKALPPNTVTWG